MAYALAGIAALALLAGVGWWAYARRRSQLGALQEHTDHQTEFIDAHTKQDAAFDKVRTHDLSLDREFLLKPLGTTDDEALRPKK